MAHTVGGGQKVRWLKSAMAPLRERQDLVVLFVDRWGHGGGHWGTRGGVMAGGGLGRMGGAWGCEG